MRFFSALRFCFPCKDWPSNSSRHIAFWASRGCGQESVVAGARAICGIRVVVDGLESLPDGAALIASRHQSAFDTVVWLTLVPRCCYVFKHELLRVPMFGPLIPLAGMIPIDRSGGAAALRTCCARPTALLPSAGKS